MTEAAEEGRRFPCAMCGAKLAYAPGTEVLACAYCGHENRIAAKGSVAELDYLAGLRDLAATVPTVERRTVKCDACAASFEFDPKLHASACPFCASPIVVEPTLARVFQPQGVLPFQIAERDARGALKTWLGSRWFAPNSLRTAAEQNGSLSGLYVPFWTYDSQTATAYTGQRGDAYWVTQTVTVNVNGKPQRQTRRVRKIRWTPVSGRVARAFDDVLVVASHSLPRQYVEALAPWPLGAVKPYDAAWLAGYRAETYQVALDDGFEDARHQMDAVIRGDIRRDIGGDAQRIGHVDTRHANVTFKQVLLPVWMAAYRHGGKSYRFMVNAATGEVQGERPYSWVKIALAVVTVLILAGLGAAIYNAGGF
ncbi:MAG: primosomal protein N' (replication factor Y) - superfamily II helicase [Alphaproteobacteria bacterium]|nr:primosomal protein N' (replication factor Y) - superfamily II helicase [Alphaproteobacteria bacterium]MDX5369874.1 primosomal protein N' (replication factor Y) - superfamily II helicase [Alphaproteobacteria bacterium]MDX5464490.1 primosomal protein N' (replication factor Y) - superfamily II helicase [Alphaproteobacteria bacterium]